jgi:hypothetical protein
MVILEELSEVISYAFKECLSVGFGTILINRPYYLVLKIGELSTLYRQYLTLLILIDEFDNCLGLFKFVSILTICILVACNFNLDFMLFLVLADLNVQDR